MALDNLDPEILAEFVAETLEQLNGLEEQFVLLEENPGDLEIINAIFRPFHSIKGSAAFFDLTAMKDVAHKIENLLDDLRKERKKVSEDIISAILRGLDLMKDRLATLSQNEYEESLTDEEKDYIHILEDIDKKYSEESEEKEEAPSIDDIGKAIEGLGEDLISQHPKLKQLVDILNKFREEQTGKPLSSLTETGKKEDQSNLLYMYNGQNLTQYITRFKQFITKAKESAPAEEDCLAFSAALNDLIDLCRQESFEDLIPVLFGVKDDFENIRSSAVGFDELLLSLVEDDINNFLKNIETVTPGEAGIKKVGEILIDEGTITKSDLEEAVNKQKKVGEILIDEGKVSKDDLDKALSSQKDQMTAKPVEKTTVKAKKEVFKTMRVDENKIDHFMNFVGELIVSSEVFNYLQKKIEGTNQFGELAKEYKNANLAFNDLSNNLQKSLMEIRKVPIKNLLQKMPRMVRDIAKNLDKNIALEIVGEKTKIDKSILENIENPLIHIVRNAADHGMETVTERLAAGKTEQGNVKISAVSDETFFHLYIDDDGRGINIEKMKSAALKKGSISQSRYDTISDKDALRLIFLPGVSSAKKITDLSGRGVGMDVVMSNLKKANGSVIVNSEVGKGTKIHIQVPLSVTLIVVDGLVVQVGDGNFIIPISKIKESIRPKSENIVTFTEKGEMVKIREELFPLVRLHKMFHINGQITNPSEGVVMLVEHEHGRACFLVDRLIGQQQVVQKNMGDYLKGISTIAGGAIMGDGKVGLILNVEGIVSKSTH